MTRSKEELASCIVSVLNNEDRPIYAENFALIDSLVETSFSKSAYSSFKFFIQYDISDDGEFVSYTRFWLKDEDVEELYKQLVA